MAKKGYNIRVDEEVITNLEGVAEAQHMDASKFAAVVISKFSDLKPEHGLDALASIPKEFFRRGPGRPPSTTHRTDVHRAVPAEHVA
ncbi:MAG TPA: hypothetical protein VG710_17940 [Opitutus sp.]|nr:hypothetical protein [Opitutus sp.]